MRGKENRKLLGDLTAAFQYLRGAYQKDGDRLFSRACCDRTRGNDSKLNKGGKALEQVAQGGSRCFTPKNTQAQVEQSSEQPQLVEDIPADCRGIGLDDL